ncbi:hypothetical protein SLI_0855 [Streptomyces lividans 1326]|uniref:Uncharacterized protein n=1 Tax=Streptomyces lividans 1326 TaxID=1200984 RepID=A0A7U9DKE2_STRLI|nr:hypothetical protein SLI_0855 [Streptomyces lividans 1326]
MRVPRGPGGCRRGDRHDGDQRARGRRYPSDVLTDVGRLPSAGASTIG